MYRSDGTPAHGYIKEVGSKFDRMHAPGHGHEQVNKNRESSPEVPKLPKEISSQQNSSDITQTKLPRKKTNMQEAKSKDNTKKGS